MKTVLPRETDARRKDTQIPSGKTRGKPKSAAHGNRKDSEIPADRGAREVESTTQGSE